MASLLLDGQVGHGIGGAHAVVEIGGTRTFAKSVPVTEEERRSPRSTANLFGVPAHCQYGVGRLGSPGFNVWRELIAHERTTRWVLDGEEPGFPLLYHARVLPGSGYRVPAEHADVDAVATYWGGERSVARRLEAIAAAPTSLVLFLEHVPWNLEDWLRRELSRGGAAVDAAVALVDRTLPSTVQAMNDRGVFHFDTHLGNVLTDGRGVYVSDFGLATSPDFHLGDDERRFLVDHRRYDPAYVTTRVVNALVTALSGAVDPAAPDPAARNDYVRRCAEGVAGTELPASACAFVTRYAPLAVVLNDLHWRQFTDPARVPFPAAAIEAAADDVGLVP